MSKVSRVPLKLSSVPVDVFQAMVGPHLSTANLARMGRAMKNSPGEGVLDARKAAVDADLVRLVRVVVGLMSLTFREAMAALNHMVRNPTPAMTTTRTSKNMFQGTVNQAEYTLVGPNFAVYYTLNRKKAPRHGCRFVTRRTASVHKQVMDLMDRGKYGSPAYKARYADFSKGWDKHIELSKRTQQSPIVAHSQGVRQDWNALVRAVATRG